MFNKNKIPTLCLFVLFVSLLLSTMLFSGENKPAIYENLQPDEFMTSWLVTNPIPVFKDTLEKRDDAVQKKRFNMDLLQDFGGETSIDIPEPGKKPISNWVLLNSKEDIVDLVKRYGEKEYVVVYAYAEINMTETTKTLLGVGSDDGVKVWLNGELIHQNWSGRPVNVDDDIVPVTLQKGKNRLLLKVQNMQLGWGFACRIMGAAAKAEKLMSAAAMGQMDDVNKLIEYGADVNLKGKNGLTAYQFAQIKGRTAVLQILKEHGADPNIPFPETETLVDLVFTNVFNDKTSGAAVLVAQDGQVVFEKGYGNQNLEEKIPVTPETQFRIGSVTKQLTASAILKLQEQGKISAKDKLSKYIPDFPRGDEVTIHHLLTHTSGIHSYTNETEFYETVEETTTPAQLVEQIKSYEFEFDPGEKWSYCNSGYFILGYLVEQLSGLSYNDFLQQNFFEPLGMTNTGVHYKGIELPHEAPGYSWENGEFNRALDWDMSWAGGAGNLYSTVGDMYKWNEAVFNDKVLQQSSLKAAFTPVKLNDGTEPQDMGKYGYGWTISNLRGLREIAHGGGLHGFSSFLTRFPDINATVVVLCNSMPLPPGVAPEYAAHQIGEIYFWKQLEQQKTMAEDTSVDPAVFKDYVGRYDYGQGIMDITTQDGQLFTQFTGQGKVQIYPSSETEFFLKVVNAQIVFNKDDNGNVTSLTLHQAGRDMEALKMVEEQ